MADPYRHSAQDRPGEEVIARRSPWIVGLTTAVTGAGTIAPLFARQLAALNEVVALTAWLFSPVAIFMFARSVRRLMLPQCIVLSEDGIRFAWPQPVPFVPWMRRHDAFVPWADLIEIRTSTTSVNGIGDTELIVGARGGALHIPEDGFDVPLQTVQARILDEVRARAERAKQEAGIDLAPRADELARRYATPTILRARTAGTVGSIVFFLGLAAGPGAVAVMVPSWITGVMAVGGGLLFGSIAATIAVLAYRTHVLRLSRDGVQLGPTAARGTSIPWAQLRVRKRVLNGVTVAVELRGTRGQFLSLSADYGIAKDELAAMLDPT